MSSLTIIIVEKGGTLKLHTVKDYNVNELYKKCGFKKSEGFNLQTEWRVKLNGTKYVVQMYGKTEGKANMENKYDFPPPVDTTLYFGCCALVASVQNSSSEKTFVNLSFELWNKMYEKLFGGFEDLAVTCVDDDNELDELENIPSNMKTKKGGYLKDGFVVDSSDTESYYSTEDEEEFNANNKTIEENENDDDDEYDIDDIGSELSEESYDSE